MEEITTSHRLLAVYEILEDVTDAELAEGAELFEGIIDKLRLVGVGELVSQLREAEDVTEDLM
jgi:hypothetical protein